MLPAFFYAFLALTVAQGGAAGDGFPSGKYRRPGLPSQPPFRHFRAPNWAPKLANSFGTASQHGCCDSPPGAAPDGASAMLSGSAGAAVGHPTPARARCELASPRGGRGDAALDSTLLLVELPAADINLGSGEFCTADGLGVASGHLLDRHGEQIALCTTPSSPRTTPRRRADRAAERNPPLGSSGGEISALWASG